MNEIELQKIIQISTEAGDELKKYFGREIKFSVKGLEADFITQADIASETFIIDKLSKEFPSATIFSEEKGKIQKDGEITFIIDPLDGTNNFLLGIPNFCVAISALIDNKEIAAVISNPITNTTYSALQGSGAYKNGKTIKVNSTDNVSKSTFAFTTSYETDPTKVSTVFEALLHLRPKRVMDSWCPTFEFCLLAEGKIESMICLNSEIYDVSAGKFIAKEAGAFISEVTDKVKKSTFAVSSTESLLQVSQKVLEKL